MKHVFLQPYKQICPPDFKKFSVGRILKISLLFFSDVVVYYI